jgi:hypothetical protein
VPEAGVQVRVGGGACDLALLRELNGCLHELSQPMTVLLCTLDYGVGLESLTEMRETMAISQEACERLRRGVAAMQAQVRQAIEVCTNGKED